MSHSRCMPCRALPGDACRDALLCCTAPDGLPALPLRYGRPVCNTCRDSAWAACASAHVTSAGAHDSCTGMQVPCRPESVQLHVLAGGGQVSCLQYTWRLGRCFWPAFGACGRWGDACALLTETCARCLHRHWCCLGVNTCWYALDFRFTCLQWEWAHTSGVRAEVLVYMLSIH